VTSDKLWTINKKMVESRSVSKHLKKLEKKKRKNGQKKKKEKKKEKKNG